MIYSFWWVGRQISGFPRNFLPSSRQQGWPRKGKTLICFILGVNDWGQNKERKSGADLKVYESKETGILNRKSYKLGEK
jgi:hypothetical protein